MTDGNKNVTALLDAAGFRVAGYAYGPFGQVLSMDGALAEVNPFRFSSEFHDDETGLVYYNYRYYSPSLGRWTKRDPIEETGGLNLYGMVDGQLVNCFDNYGLISIYVHGVNSNHVGYDSLRSALKSRMSMPTNMFEQYSIDMNWAISNGKGGFINPTLKASDSIGYSSNWFQGLSAQQWRAVAKLKKIAQQLREVIKSDTAFCSETVNIVAHSQGTLISLAALQQGLKIDYVIFMGSPMDKEIVEDASHNTDIEAGARNTQEIINMWSTDDGTARIKGGIGGFGLPKNKISTKVIDIKLDRVDHFGKTGWWNGSWLDNGNNLKDTEGYWSKVLYTATDPSKLADKTKESIKKIQGSASSYMSR